MHYARLTFTSLPRISDNGLIELPKPAVDLINEPKPKRGTIEHDDSIFHVVGSEKYWAVFVARGERFDDIFSDVSREEPLMRTIPNAQADFKKTAGGKLNLNLRHDIFGDYFERLLRVDRLGSDLQLDVRTDYLLIRHRDVAQRQDRHFGVLNPHLR